MASAADPQALLRLEEAALDRLDQDPQAGPWTGVSRMVPSEERQTGDRAALESALFGPGDVAGRLQRSLQAPGLKAEKLKRSLGPWPGPLEPEAWLGSPVSAPYRHLWRGPRDGAWAGLLVSTAPVEHAAALQAQGPRRTGRTAVRGPAAGGHPGAGAPAAGAQLGAGRRGPRCAAAAVAGLAPRGLGRGPAHGPGGAGRPGGAGLDGPSIQPFRLARLDAAAGHGHQFWDLPPGHWPAACSSFVAVNLAALTNIAAVGVLAFAGPKRCGPSAWSWPWARAWPG